MNEKYSIFEKRLESSDLNESRINYHLSLRKKNYNKIISNKRKLMSEIESLFPRDTSQETSDNLSNNNLLKILQKEEILLLINKTNGKINNNNLTELFQCLFTLDFNLNQNLLDTIYFISNNKIYIFLVDILEQLFNSNNLNNIPQLIFKILQILFKYSSNEENNVKLLEYINDKIVIFHKLLSYISNHQIFINKNHIFFYLVIILYNLSIESSTFFKNLQKNKIQDKIISIVNDKENNINFNDRNMSFVIEFLSLDILDKNIVNLDENYIQQIFNLLNNKGIKSSFPMTQDLSINCLCYITSLYESENFYKKIVYSKIFDNIFQYIKNSGNINSIIVSLKIVNNILTEKNINLNRFIESDLLIGLMQVIINYETNKNNINSDLLHHIINIFLYLVKSPLFYLLIDNNQKFMINVISLIGKSSNQVTHDILTFIKDVINESYTISQKLILNNMELMWNLICLVRDECHNDKIKIMALVIIGKIIKYNHEKMNDEDTKIIEYENLLKEIIESNLLNNNSINETLKKTFKIILDMITDE